ncbi:MAG: DUF4097 family beta strand repeat-containing protein [Balneolaceae bacterium]|nr:DUF4097 family beta strand repeat-containing protein [Balneolaceae bacterium]
MNQTYSIDKNGTIELQSDDADIVEITGSDRNDVRLVVDYHLKIEGLTLGDKEKFEMQVTERGGNLIIQEKPRNSSFNINLGVMKEDYTIRIEVPQGVNLNLDGDDDTYEITNIHGSINVDADDSEITLNRCQGEEFDFDLDDGELFMDGGYGLLNIDIDDGEADIRSGQFSRVHVDMDDADIHLATTLADDGDYNFSSDDGSIDFIVLGGGGEIWIDHDEINVSAGSEFEETRSSEDYNEYRLRGGNARVRINTDDGDVRLSVQ